MTAYNVMLARHFKTNEALNGPQHLTPSFIYSYE